MRALDKVIGYSSIKKELFKIIDVLNNPDKYTKLGVSIPNGVMLEGESGIGKTLMAASFVSKKSKDELSMDFTDEENEILILLAGKAATEIVMGDVDMGANNDLGRAFNGVRRLLDNYAEYDFNSWCHGDGTSQKIYDHLDSVTGAEISRYYKETKRLLIKNRAFLDAVIENLRDKKFLSYKDILKIRTEGGF